MVSLRDQFLDDQLVVVIRELDCVDDMDVLVKLRLSIDHRQICDHIVVLDSILF